MQITSLYGGPLEFIFVVESTEDPAYHAVSHLLSEFKVNLFFREVILSVWSHANVNTVANAYSRSIFQYLLMKYTFQFVQGYETSFSE